MNEFELFGEKKEIEQINLQDAKRVLESGLKYYVGEKMQWCSEYNNVCDWLEDNKKRGLMLFGSNSRGKTVICQKILPVIFKHCLNRDCLVIDAKDLTHIAAKSHVTPWFSGGGFFGGGFGCTTDLTFPIGSALTSSRL